MKQSSTNGSAAVLKELKGINVTTKRLADGSTRLYYYHRATGRRLPDDVRSPDFLAAYVAAEKPLRDGGTLAGLIRAHCASPEYLNRAQSSRDIAKYLFRVIEDEYGDMTLGAINARKQARSEFLKWRDSLIPERGARAADNILAHLQAVLTWALDRGDIDEHPLESFKRAYRADRSDLIWLPEHIEAFNAKASEQLQRALLLALETGQRQGDLLRLTWNNYKNNQITLRQGKTRKRVEIPCTSRLSEMLSGMDRKKTTLILTMRDGEPWKPRYFKHCWRETSNAAGLADLNFHDLRGTAITRLAEAGCTTAQIASITGHNIDSVERMLEVYLSRTGSLARSAIATLEAHRNSK